MVDVGNRQFVVANSKKGTPAPKAIKIHRPTSEKPVKRKATSEDLVRLFGGSVTHVPQEKGAEQAD